MKKMKDKPVITYTEILSRAASSIEEEIAEWKSKCAAIPLDQREAMIDAATKDLTEKLEAIKTLYRFETGTDM